MCVFGTIFHHILYALRSSIQWYLNGVEITEKRTEFIRSEDESSYKLIIKEARTELDGKYSCVIKNDYGKIEDQCNVDVNCKCLDQIL